MVSPCDLIRRASLAGVTLNVRDGRLHAPPPATLPSDLMAALTAHKLAIVAALHVLAALQGLLPRWS